LYVNCFNCVLGQKIYVSRIMYKYTGVPCPVCIAIIFAKLLYPGNPIILGDSRVRLHLFFRFQEKTSGGNKCVSCVVPFFLDSYALPWGFLSLSLLILCSLSLSLFFFGIIIIIKKKKGGKKQSHCIREREIIPLARLKVSKKKI
jgi:hypothetical protein